MCVRECVCVTANVSQHEDKRKLGQPLTYISLVAFFQEYISLSGCHTHEHSRSSIFYLFFKWLLICFLFVSE